METTTAKLQAIERIGIEIEVEEETVLFCVENPAKDANGWFGIEIPTGVIWGESVLARLAAAQKSAETCKGGLGVETIDAGKKKGILLRGVTASAMRDVAVYLARGSVPLEDPAAVTALANLLEYFGLLTLRCEYPPRFLQIKLRETWFRKNLYNPAFAKSVIQRPLYGLWQVKSVAEVLMGAIRLRAEKHCMETSPVTNSPVIFSPAGRNQGFHLEIPSGATDWVRSTSTPLTAERAKEFGRAPLWGHSRQQAGRACCDSYEELLSQYETKKAKTSKTKEANPPELPLSRAGLLWIPKLGLSSERLWANVLLAGGAVAHCLLGLGPAPKMHDFDLFMWGMDHEQGLAKIVELICALKPERVYRSKRALTLFACRDGRKYQIVLRLYRTPAEILHSFDVDACCVGFDGSSVLMTERARHAFDSMTNVVDFDLLSPSYESRLVKYMDRYFAIFIPGFDSAYLNHDSLLSISEECDAVRRAACRYMQGLDIILFAVFGGFCHRRSDYDESGPIRPKQCFTLTGFAGSQKVAYDSDDAEEWITPDGELRYAKTTQGVQITAPGSLEGYVVRPEQDFTPEIIEMLICNAPKSLGYVKPKIELLVLGAGEQATSTYHATVLTNVEVWYNGCFFNVEAKNSGEALTSLMFKAKEAITKERRADRRHPKAVEYTRIYGWYHPAHVSEREKSRRDRPAGIFELPRPLMPDGEAVGLARHREAPDHRIWQLAIEESDDELLAALSAVDLAENPRQSKEKSDVDEGPSDDESPKSEV